MFGIGMPELILILVIALIVIGPARLPEIARTLGRAYGGFARAMNQTRREIDSVTGDFEQERPRAEKEEEKRPAQSAEPSDPNRG